MTMKKFLMQVAVTATAGVIAGLVIAAIKARRDSDGAGKEGG